MRMKSWENYIYLDHSRRARGGRTAPAPRSGPLSTVPSIITCRTPANRIQYARAPHRRPPESGDDRTGCRRRAAGPP